MEHDPAHVAVDGEKAGGQDGEPDKAQDDEADAGADADSECSDHDLPPNQEALVADVKGTEQESENLDFREDTAASFLTLSVAHAAV